MTEKMQVTNQELLDAIRELTKQTTVMAENLNKLKEEWAKWRKAGKF